MALTDAAHGGHDLAGGAEAALEGVLIDEGLLDRMEPAVGASPSTVVTSRPSALAASTMQAFTRAPSSRTVHAPHSPRLQPFLVPVSPRCSRNRSSRLVRASKSRACPVPLTRKPMATREEKTGPSTAILLDCHELGPPYRRAAELTPQAVATYREAGTSCQSPPLRLRLLPRAWPGAVSPM